MGDLERIEEKVDWCVAALKALLQYEVEDDRPWDDYPESIPPEAEIDMSQFEFASVINPPKPEEPPPCSHNHQVLVGGVVKCARCGEPLIATGLVRNQITPSGQIMSDPNPPQWARSQSPGPSSKNPGGRLVPHSA